MNRSQLEHVVRAACGVVGVRDVLVIGSQAVLASISEFELPDEATRSVEVDVGVDLALAGLGEDGDESRFADVIEGALGRGSDFHRLNGYRVRARRVVERAFGTDSS